MVLDCIVAQASLATSGTEGDLTAIDSFRVQQGRGGAYLRAFLPLGANNIYGALSTPSMGQYRLITLGQLTANALPNRGLHLLNPIHKLVESEVITASGMQDSGGAQTNQMVVILSYGNRVPAKNCSGKPAIGFYFTPTNATVANVWTQIENDVFSGARELIPGKRYRITKAVYMASDAIAFRMRGPSWGANRPGGPGATDVNQSFVDFRTLDDVPEFTAGETIDMEAFATGATTGTCYIEVQEA